MSRFAVDPRWLVHLQPTMAPVATSKWADFLGHPDEAFDYFRKAGVSELVCEEKHMGCRAVLILARNSGAASERFGITNEAAGASVTRTGRAFFGEASLTVELLDRVRAAVSSGGLWLKLATNWLVLDTELLSWSAKAKELLRNQYAAAAPRRQRGGFEPNAASSMASSPTHVSRDAQVCEATTAGGADDE